MFVYSRESFGLSRVSALQCSGTVLKVPQLEHEACHDDQVFLNIPED